MINESDYKAGWTTPIRHPVTGNMCYGAAARNVKMMQYGGLNGVYNLAFLSGVEYVQPLINGFQHQLQQAQQQLQHSQMMNQTLLNQLQAYVPVES